MDTGQQGSTSSFLQMHRKTLYGYFRESTARRLDDKLSFIEHKMREITRCPQDEFQTLNQDLRLFKSDLKKFWISSNYMDQRFITKNEVWLNGSVSVHTWSPNIKPGRPIKDFQELSDRSKRRKTKEIREKVPVEELTYAASVAASKILKEVTSTPIRAVEYKKIIDTAQNTKPKKNKKEEALFLFVEGGFTRNQWELLHESNKDVFPCYTLIREAKKACYPKEESLLVTETCAEVLLQALVDHTATRLCLYLEEVLQGCTKLELDNLELITKWGCDGSHQTLFQQKFTDSSYKNDSNIFQSSMVPLRLQSHIGDQIKILKILWQNPSPSSTRFCRPIRIRFLHETVDITKEDLEYVEDQAKQLLRTKITIEKGFSYVRHTFLPTMVDAKVWNAVTCTSSTMRCYICGKTSKDFNNFENTDVEDPQSLRFGLSTLHARIRLFETVLHLAYKLPLKKWQARSTEEKKIVQKNKERIQQEYRERNGLIIDMPKAGFGNSNSRRFFSDPDLAAEITGIKKDFILKPRVILEAISSGHNINSEKFFRKERKEFFCKDTAKIYVELYGWHPMTPTLHKILVHGSTVIKYAILPIGQLSEEAAEARNKHYRSYRQDYARKFSRVQCNRDVLNRLLQTSDPYVSCNRKRKRSQSQPFLTETLDLFEPEEPQGHLQIEEDPTSELQTVKIHLLLLIYSNF